VPFLFNIAASSVDFLGLWRYTRDIETEDHKGREKVQVRWNFKLLPNQTQEATLEDWLVTLRKHRNYALRERTTGFETNNKESVSSIIYVYGSYCDLESRIEFGSCCPLTCPVLKHGVIPQDLELATKETKVKDLDTKGVFETVVKWDTASGIQMKVTTQLRKTRDNFSRVDPNVLQRNVAHLDTAFSNFFSKKLGYPNFVSAQ